MNKVVYFNTAIGSLNTGDQIINEAARRELASVLAGKFLLELPTHTPVLHSYQSVIKNPLVKYTDDSLLKFIAGTNILANNALRPWPNWNVNIFNKRPYNNSICVGVGVAPNSNRSGHYSKWLYRAILSKRYIHSVRDERTKAAFESLGLRAINTGCPTLWGLSKDKCRSIKTKKSSQAVFTLTDYARDYAKDQALIDILQSAYDEVYFWPQGSDDMAYIQKLQINNVKILSPQLEAYRQLLLRGDIDFVGTRLHAGIFAMQHGVRSLIITVDNRARDMHESYNINALERSKIDSLRGIIESTFSTNVKIDETKIMEWKRQFLNTDESIHG